jgi:hypothetical protein
MINFYLFSLGAFIVFYTIYFRFIFVRIPFDVEDITNLRAVIYLLLTIIFTSILLAIYYSYFRAYILKKPINEESRLFKIKVFFNEKLLLFGPTTALRIFFLFITSRIPPTIIPYRLIVSFFIRLLTRNRFVNRTYYHKTLYLGFIGLPRFIVATMFIIDVCYYEHIELFFKWSLLLGIPLIFKSVLGILNLYYGINIVKMVLTIEETKTIENGKEVVKRTYRDPADHDELPLEEFLDIYDLVFEFVKTYIKIQDAGDYFFWMSIYTIHCYIIGWTYILYFYGPNFLDLLSKFFEMFF